MVSRFLLCRLVGRIPLPSDDMCLELKDIRKGVHRFYLVFWCSFFRFARSYRTSKIPLPLAFKTVLRRASAKVHCFSPTQATLSGAPP